MLYCEEILEPGLRFAYEVEEVITSTQTKFQNVTLVRTKTFGNALVIDGLMQSSDCDERVYHESLVHPAMLLHPNPKSVFIGGAGEGSTAREVLKHNTVETCVMVDIDEEVVEFCKKILPQNSHVHEDSRLKVIIDCAMKQLAEAPNNFDVIIMDLDDPLEGGPCYQLYTQEFYTMCHSKLNEGGILVSQCSAAGIKNHSMVFTPVHNTLKEVFPKVYSYAQHVYSFAETWGFTVASTDAKLELPSPEEVDKVIAARGLGDLFFMDGISFKHIFALPKYLRDALASETRILHKGQYATFVSSVAAIAEKKEQEEEAPQ